MYVLSMHGHFLSAIANVIVRNVPQNKLLDILTHYDTILEMKGNYMSKRDNLYESWVDTINEHEDLKGILDDLVSQVCGNLSSDTNNAGPMAQLKFLERNGILEQTFKILREQIES